MEACPCHPQSLAGDDASGTYHAKRRRFATESCLERNCRRKGCRGAELAAGFLMTMLQNMFGLAASTVALLAAGLDLQTHKRLLIDKWVAGRAFLAYILQLKCGFYTLFARSLSCPITTCRLRETSCELAIMHT